jgi:hypothetical protein
MEGLIMSIAAVTDIANDAPLSDDRRPTSTITPNAGPRRSLDWRLRYAYQLAQEADTGLPSHEDPWIEEAAQLIHTGFLGNRSHRPTPRQWHFKQALDLHGSGSLVEKVLQARLLSQHEPQEIAAKCHIHPQTIEAYASLLFDVRGQDGVRRWFPQQFRKPPRPNLMIWQIGMVLTTTGAFEGPEPLERYVDVLCSLEGPTMADGLPARGSPRFSKEFQFRQALADPLLRRSRPMAQLMERFEQSALRDVQASHASDESVELGIQILRKAKIPAALRREIAGLRENRAPTQLSSTVTEAARAETGRN